MKVCELQYDADGKIITIDGMDELTPLDKQIGCMNGKNVRDRSLFCCKIVTFAVDN